MILDEQRVQEIAEVFKQVHSYKEDAKALTSSANDLLKVLAEKIDPDNPKSVLGGLKKAYREFVAEMNGEEDSLETALEILQALGGRK